MRRPLVGPARRPSSIRVADSDLAADVRTVVGDLIPVTIAATPELDELANAMFESFAKGTGGGTGGDRGGEEPSCFENGRVSPAAVADLFAAARLLRYAVPLARECRPRGESRGSPSETRRSRRPRTDRPPSLRERATEPLLALPAARRLLAGVRQLACEAAAAGRVGTRGARRASCQCIALAKNRGDLSSARRRYAVTVPRPTEQAPAIARCDSPTSNLSRRISRNCLIRSLFAGIQGVLLGKTHGIAGRYR